MITSDRLKNARLAKGWTRDELSERSKVSARQIKRIEDDEVSSRSSTIERLAQALSLDAGVLVGEAPMPSELRRGALGNPAIGEAIKRLRKDRGWSRNQLSEEAEVSRAQIQRIERGEVREIRGSTLERLAKALEVDRIRLTDVEPTMTGRSAQIGARVSPYVRLAFDLVERQYGIGAKDLIQLSPLLFAMAAESSLAKRQSNLDSVRADLDRVKASMTHSMTSDWNTNVALEVESIRAGDVLGIRLGDRRGGLGTNGPFERYLCSLALDLADVTVNVEGGATNTWGMGWYGVCERMLGRLCGRDSLARQALVVGAVRISDIPEELMTEEAMPRRVEWLEEQFEHWWRR